MTGLLRDLFGIIMALPDGDGINNEVMERITGGIIDYCSLLYLPKI